MLNPSCKYYKLTNGYLKPSILTKGIKKIASRILLLPGNELKPIAFENDKSFAEERYRKLYEQNYGKFNKDVVEKYEQLIEEAYKNKEYGKEQELEMELDQKIYDFSKIVKDKEYIRTEWPRDSHYQGTMGNKLKLQTIEMKWGNRW